MNATIGHSCMIENYAFIGSGPAFVVISKLGDTFIGARAVVGPRIKIGYWSTVELELL